MKRPHDDWKGWLPDLYYFRAEVRSDMFHSSLKSAIMDILGRCGGAPRYNETADFLEKLAKELREKE